MKQRVISAIFVLIICVPLILLGGIWFDIGLTIVGCLGLKEIMKLTSNEENFLMKIFSYLSLVLIINGSLEISIGITCLLLFIPLIFIDRKKYNYSSAIVLFGNVVFLGYVFSLFKDIRQDDILVFVFLILITTFTDIFAYFFGKAIGKHKLIPKVSPAKTIEGTVCGSLVATIVGSIFYIYEIDPGVNILSAILLVLILSIVGQMGDLIFSSIKRHFDVKDFSNLIPGHGGILDRLDSLIFVVITYSIILGLI